MKTHLILFIVFIFVSGGCTVLEHKEQISVLQGIEKSRKDIDDYMSEQARGFSMLKHDIDNNRLEAGISERYAIAKYGDPVFKENSEKNTTKTRRLFYRDPLDYFSEDRIYLDFDENGKLTDWTTE
jgi:hypothetical protein